MKIEKSCLVHDEGGALLQVGDTLVREVQYASGSTDQDVHHVVETHDVVLEGRAPGSDLSDAYFKTETFKDETNPHQTRIDR